jgi:hypothetical protein
MRGTTDRERAAKLDIRGFSVSHLDANDRPHIRAMQGARSAVSRHPCGEKSRSTSPRGRLRQSDCSTPEAATTAGFGERNRLSRAGPGCAVSSAGRSARRSRLTGPAGIREDPSSSSPRGLIPSVSWILWPRD